jgi:hypothetical protein
VNATLFRVHLWVSLMCKRAPTHLYRIGSSTIDRWLLTDYMSKGSSRAKHLRPGFPASIWGKQKGTLTRGLSLIQAQNQEMTLNSRGPKSRREATTQLSNKRRKGAFPQTISPITWNSLKSSHQTILWKTLLERKNERMKKKLNEQPHRNGAREVETGDSRKQRTYLI